MIEALRIIAANSPLAGREAMACMRAIQAKSPMVQQRYNHVVESAFGDPNAEFTAEERRLIADSVEVDGHESRSETIRFRVTPNERAELKAMAVDAGLDMSDYLRSLVWPE